jgi:hypothetical protein
MPYFGGDAACQQCGGAPAMRVKFGRVTGMILWFKLERMEAITCRSCGRAVGRRMQSKTMVTGWWGVIAFFVNLFWILRNAVTLGRLGRIAEPQTRRGGSLDPGRPVFLRAGMAVTVLLFGAWAVVANVVDEQPLREGDCVRNVAGSTTNFETVACSAPNLGRVVAIVDTEPECPLATDAVLQLDGRSEIYCMDQPA